MDRLIRKICTVALISGIVALPQVEIDRLAKELDVQAEVVDNLVNNGQTHDIRITLKNTGNTSIPVSGWQIFFHNTFLLFPSVYPKSNSTVLSNEHVRVVMVQGDLYYFEPITGFKAIGPGETRVITLVSAVWSVSRTDFMPNWYVVSADGPEQPRVLEATRTLEFVRPFKTARQWKRYTNDAYNPFTAQDRAARLHVPDVGKAVNVIIPTPKSLEISESGPKVRIDSSWRIYASSKETEPAANHLNKATNIPVVTTPPSGNIKHITLSIASAANPRPERYTISINTTGIQLTGDDVSGLFYAIQSLISIIAHYENRDIPTMSVTDEPRFGYRGMHLDVSRNFHTVDDVKRLMGAMATYKLNKLHLHLSDDEGWRIEIPGLPELTQIGSKRCHDLEERKCVIPQWGSGPFANSSGTGYYTADDYKNILQAANDLHIEVIPELDMPGHAHAAIVAMENRYRKYSGMNNTQSAEQYRLIDPNDQSEYITVQQWMDNAINPCLESTYAFIAKVIEEVKALHQEVQPLRTYHFGGDEVAGGAWEKSPACLQLLQQHPQYNVSKGLKKYFAERMSELTARQGLGMRGWEDAFADGNGNPFPLSTMNNSDMSTNPWDNIWEWGAAARAYKLANAGYKVVMSQATDLYFDQPYEPDPEERGFYWATRFTDTFKVFGFLPDSLYDNIDVTRSGQSLSKADVCGADLSKCDSLEKPENIIGIQGQLWSETVRTSANLDYMIFPRLLALAERAWHKANFEAPGLSPTSRGDAIRQDWINFANTLGYKELKRLDGMNIQYRVPPPGARFEGGKVKVSTTFPGLPIQYRVGNEAWRNVTGDVTWQTDLQLRTLSTDGKRESRAVPVLQETPVPWTTQPMIDYIANHVTARIEVVDNLHKVDNTMTVRLSLTNTNRTDIPAGTWRIYFYSLYGFIVGNLSCGMRVGHVNGGLFYVAPISLEFRGLDAGKTLSCTLQNFWWSVSRTDQMPNWYVSGIGMIPKILKNTADETLSFVGVFDTPAKWKRTVVDVYNPWNVSDRNAMHKRVTLPNRDRWRIVPTPTGTMDTNPDVSVRLHRNYGWVVISSRDFLFESNFLADYFELPKLNTTVQNPNTAAKKVSFVKTQTSGNPEQYNLEVLQNSVTISAEDARGALHGVQTLISLSEGANGTIPKLTLSDKPRFSYRGLMVDTARNFKPVSWVLRLLDVMSAYKLNVLHLHLSDDEGWRVEIPGLQELTKVGGRRCHSDIQNECVVPALGSGPDSTTSGSGFYNVTEYRDILQYAADRHIDVIPEIDMPGHSSAAITSMFYRETRIESMKQAGATAIPVAYRLSDVDADSSVESVQKWKANAINPCLNSSYSFVEKIVKGFKTLHMGIMPLKVFHIGGDEVPEGAWEASEHCRNRTNGSHVPSTRELQKEFMERVSEILTQNNLTMAAWADGMYANNRPNPVTDYTKDVYAYPWSNIWGTDGAMRISEFADAGYKVVMAPATHLYFDMPQEPDPEERGLYWATRYTDTQKVFGLMPDDIYANADVDRMGQPVDLTKICRNQTCPNPRKRQNIMGMQAGLFSETVRTEEHFHYMLFPRLLAFAERAWHKASWENVTDRETRDTRRKEDWERFVDTLGFKEMPRLEKMGVKYRVSPPGGALAGGRLKVNTVYPNHGVEFSDDGGRTWASVRGSERLLAPRTMSVLIRTSSPVLHRPSRAVRVTSSETSASGELNTNAYVILICSGVVTMILSVL